MIFRRTLQRYGRTPEPVTPYQRAGQLWDERIGSSRVQARNWRLMAFGCLTLSIGLAAGLIWQSARSRVTPFVVEVDKFGEVQAVASAVQNYQPTDAQIAWFLAHFISDVRSLPTDPVLVRKNWLEAYEFVTNHGAVFLNGYAASNDPFKAIGDRSVSVEVTSVVRASQNSFQVKWTEQTYRQDSLVSTENWTAILTIAIKPPSTADVLRENPLGLYVDGIDWSREFDPGATS
jgi:type IV secretion system protein VirB5